MDFINRILSKSMSTIVIVLGIICAFSYGITKLANQEEEICRIISIDKVEDRSGNSHGFYTEVYYIVTTDKGSYRIETTGINAHPECLAMKVDSTYVIGKRGISFPIGGIYPSVISYKPLNN